MERQLKHLEFVQGVVNRLAANSFRIKGWSVVLVSALFVLAAREGRIAFSFIALVPLAFLWWLDGYFLWQERLFRALYDHVRSLDESKIDFSMGLPGFVWVGRPDGGGGAASKATLAPCVTRNCTAGFWASRHRGEWPTSN